MAAPLGPGNVLGELRWDLDGLNAKLDAYAKAFHVNLADAVKQTAFKLELAIKTRTPVDTGRARNSWHTVIWSKSPSYAYKDNHGKAYDGTTSQSPARDTEALVATNVVYMLALEAGWSAKSPAGMVRVSVREAKQNFINAINAAKAKTKV